VLEQVRRLKNRKRVKGAQQAEGRDAEAQEPELPGEVARYRSASALSFQSAQISRITATDADQPFEIDVSFIGLNGPSGVLPRYYSELVLQQIKLKNLALRDFLDIMNGRAIRNHLDASRKYRLPAAVELAEVSYADPISGVLRALVGMATPRLETAADKSPRLSVPAAVLMSYAGLLSRSVRSAAGLEQILNDYTGRRVEVIQLLGRWAGLHPEDQTRLPSLDQPNGNYAQLGVNAVLGARIFDVQGTFRLRLGPLHYGEFSDLLPGTQMMQQIVDLTRFYAGPTLGFDVQLSLRHTSVPPCMLGGGESSRRRLGLNTWLYTSERSTDAADVIVDMSDAGLR
jgi:type VI secretion system protein ImpH